MIESNIVSVCRNDYNVLLLTIRQLFYLGRHSFENLKAPMDKANLS